MMITLSILDWWFYLTGYVLAVWDVYVGVTWSHVLTCDIKICEVQSLVHCANSEWF